MLGAGSLCEQAGFLSGKGLPGKVEEICAWTLGVANEFVHYFSIKVQGCGTATVKVIGIGASVGFENIYHIPVV